MSEEKNIKETKSVPLSAYPIWADQYYTFTTDQPSVEYEICRIVNGVPDTSEVLVRGRVYRTPDGQGPRINLSKMLAPFLNSKINIGERDTINDYCLPVCLFSEGENLGTFIFYNSYSYDRWEYAEGGYDTFICPASPINNKIVEGSIFTQIVWNNSDKEKYLLPANYVGWDGTRYPVPAYAEPVKFGAYESRVITFIPRFDDMPPSCKGIEVGEGGGFFKVVERKCTRYVIHYLDPLGGWSQYPVNGTINKSDVYTAHESNQVFNNRNYDDFERVKYLNEIKTRWQVNLNLKSKEEAEHIPEIVASTKIYIEDLCDPEKRITPVVCIENNFEYNLHRRVRNYQITFEDSRYRIKQL